jgi:hypothetical protein
MVQGALWTNGTVSTTPSGTICEGACGSISGTPVFTIFDNFTVTGAGWTVNGFDYSDFFVNTPTTQYQSTNWSIWLGDPLSGGTLVASGNNIATLGTPDCTVGVNTCLVQLTVNNLSVHLNAGTYFLGTGSLETGGSTTYRAYASGNGLPGFQQSNGSTSGVPGSHWTLGSVNSFISGSDSAFDILGNPIPEPGTFALMGLAITGLWLTQRRRRTA